jgi:hypothetical protein
MQFDPLQYNIDRRWETLGPRAGFEPVIPMLEYQKTVLASDHATSVIWKYISYWKNFNFLSLFLLFPSCLWFRPSCMFYLTTVLRDGEYFQLMGICLLKIRSVRFSWQWRCRLWSPGIWCHEAFTSILEEYIASIFWVDGHTLLLLFLRWWEPYITMTQNGTRFVTAKSCGIGSGHTNMDKF